MFRNQNSEHNTRTMYLSFQLGNSVSFFWVIILMLLTSCASCKAYSVFKLSSFILTAWHGAVSCEVGISPYFYFVWMKTLLGRKAMFWHKCILKCNPGPPKHNYWIISLYYFFNQCLGFLYFYYYFFLTQAYDKQVEETLHSDERRIIVAQKDIIRLASISKKRLVLESRFVAAWAAVNILIIMRSKN